jgi:hypothetical protein
MPLEKENDKARGKNRELKNNRIDELEKIEINLKKERERKIISVLLSCMEKNRRTNITYTEILVAET